MNPRVTFYDVEPEARLGLVAKLAEAAWRKSKSMLILCDDPGETKALDDHLWTFREEAFVPHEVHTGGPLTDEDARVVIVATETRPIEAAVLIQLTPASPEFAQSFQAVIDVVDHRDETRLGASRARYKAWKVLGIAPTYKKSV